MRLWLTLDDYSGYSRWIELWEGNNPHWRGNGWDDCCDQDTHLVQRYALETTIGLRARDWFFPSTIYRRGESHGCVPITQTEWNDCLRNKKATPPTPTTESVTYRIVKVFFTDKQWKLDEIAEVNPPTYTFWTEDPVIEAGMLLVSEKYGAKMQVVSVTNRKKKQGSELTNYRIENINNLLIPNKAMKMNSVMQGMVEKMKSQFIPIKEEGVKMSMDGNVCIQSGDEYVTIDNEGNLQSYPAEMVMEIPVYSITKPTSEVKAGDIIKRKNSFFKVIAVKEGTLKCLTYSGSVSNKKEIKDFVLGKSVERVVLNMFDVSALRGGEGGSQINPMMLMLLSEENGGEFDAKTLMLMQMLGGGSKEGSGQMNPLMLMMLMGGEKKGGGLMELMLLGQMLGGGKSPFGGMFGGK